MFIIFLNSLMNHCSFLKGRQRTNPGGRPSVKRPSTHHDSGKVMSNKSHATVMMNMEQKYMVGSISQNNSVNKELEFWNGANVQTKEEQK